MIFLLVLLLPSPGNGSIFFFFNDTATPEIYPLPLHAALPIYHEAAVGGPQRAGALAIEPRILLDRGREPLLQVDEGLAAPVAADGIGERLAVTRRAVKVDHDHSIAAAGEGLRVPAVGPQVPEADLRTAVDDESDWGSAAGLETVCLRQVGVHGLVFPAP